jgi:hypothetical protein
MAGSGISWSLAGRIDTLTYNTAIGYRTLDSVTTGIHNVAFGYKAMIHDSSGVQNTAFGSNALRFNTSGNYNTAIGENALSWNYGGSNATAIGYNVKVNSSQKVRIGNTTVSIIEGQAPYSYRSDARFKTNVKEDVKGLDFINRLRPVTYTFDTRKFDEFLMIAMPDSVRRERMKN